MSNTYSTRRDSKVYHHQRDGGIYSHTACGVPSLSFDWTWTNSRPKGKRICVKCQKAWEGRAK